VSAVARRCRDIRRPLRVIWLDAHTDFNTRELSPSGSLHGMPVACLCGFGPPELTQLDGMTPAVRPQWIRQIGIRSVDPGERRFVHELDLAVFDMRYIDERGIRRALQIALEDLHPDAYLHVSFDVDCLDLRSRPASGPRWPAGCRTARLSCAWR